MKDWAKNGKQVLVVGGGISGLTAAWELARLGIGVFLIEKEAFIGGHAANLTCKATDRCLKCNNCLVEERLKAVSEEKPFPIKVRTEIVRIERTDERYHVSLKSAPAWIDPEKCTDCGLCFEKCPEALRGAIVRAPSHHIRPFYAIDPSKCRCLGDHEPPLCRQWCPEKALDFDGKEESWSLEVDGIVLAVGYTVFDPGEKKAYGYGTFKNMITAMDLEKMLRLDGDLVRVSDGKSPQKVAFVQCVGSRDASLHHEFCSRVCCGYALRMGLRIVHDHPETEITVFYMDIQNFGRDFERLYDEARSKMRLLRGLPGDFYASRNERISVSYYDEKTGRTTSEDFDLVVLSVGLMPPRGASFFAEHLHLEWNEDGFLASSEKMKSKGLVIAGAAEGPMDVAECVTHAKRAALEMRAFLGCSGT